MNTANELILRQQSIGGWEVPALEFASPARAALCLPVTGTIINSITERKESLQDWKRKIATTVKAARATPWNPRNDYAITLSLSFHRANHGNRDLDVENFVKPILDALAAGLFCDPPTDPYNISLWNFDDSNFNTLLIHRLPDATARDKEGIAICASAR